MKRRFAGAVLAVACGAMLMFGSVANAATITYSAVTTYTDSSTIPPADVARIVYTGYYGSSASGPWTAGTSSTPGGLSVTAPSPAAGATRWYTVDCTLDGQSSAKAPAVSFTQPFKSPTTPSGLSVH